MSRRLEASPYAVNGNRFGWWQRFLWRHGCKPWRRCPNGRHWWRKLYGDERGYVGRPYVCDYCATHEQPRRRDRW